MYGRENKMPEQSIAKETIVQIQAKAKPKIEEMIAEYLDGESRQSIFNFLEICKANGVKTPWSATNRWVLKLNKNTIGMIYIGIKPCGDIKKGVQQNVWYTVVYGAPNLIHEELSKEGLSDKEKEDIAHVIHGNLARCAYHKKACSPLKPVTILGKEFTESDDLCGCGDGINYGILFTNADDKTLYWINKAFELKNNV